MLAIGSRYDTMNPAHLEWMAKTVSQGRYLFCPQGSHLAIYDDQQVYFEGLSQFIQDIDAGIDA
jgi:proline iminopeptidase